MTVFIVCASRCTGKERDAESNLDYFGARHYSSTMGRWMTPDPSGLTYANPGDPQSFNLYSYVANHPLTEVDLNGLSWWDTPCDSSRAADTATSLGTGLKNVFSHLFGCPGGPSSPDDSAPWGAGIPAQGGIARNPNFLVTSHFVVDAPNNVNKQYGATIPCSSSAGQVMGAVESNFAAFGNYSAGPFSLAFHQPPQMGAGSEIPITAGYFGVSQNMGVSVASMSSQSMTFNTLPGGHLFYPGSISFSASPAGNGSINFNINLSGTFNGVFNGAKYYLGGAAFENAQWNHFLGKVKAYCSLGG